MRVKNKYQRQRGHDQKVGCDSSEVIGTTSSPPKLRRLTMNQIFLTWCALGQLTMMGIKGGWSGFYTMLEHSRGLSIFFPTIEKTDFGRVFDPVLAADYLTLVWALLPFLCGALLFVPDYQVIPEGMRRKKASMLPLILVLIGLSIYAVNFKWDGDAVLELLGRFSMGFALLGSLLVTLPAYTIRLCLAYLRLRKIDGFWGN